MQVTFDITEDELPIFMAEATEQLQMLDEGLVRLEREDQDADLLQALFRAAHTLKGSSGMIGHKRMVELTHAMETALDSLRKGQMVVSPPFIDICLEAIDALRALVDEVINGQSSPVEIPALTGRFASLSQNVQHAKEVEKEPIKQTVGQEMPAKSSQEIIIRAEISPDSIASAARAFQVMLTLQEMGEILSMDPDQSQIETARPVSVLTAKFNRTRPIQEVREALSQIAEIDQIVIEGEAHESKEATEPLSEAPTHESGKPTLGDALIQAGLITPEQLQLALIEQGKASPPVPILGHVLIQMGIINQEVLDQVIAEHAEDTKTVATRPVESTAPDRVHTKAVEKTVRTSVERLDNLMNLVGELITDRNRLNMLRSSFETQFRGNEKVDILSDTITHVGRITDQLQAEVMGIRMLPISNVFNKFPRLVRDLSRKADKQIDLVMRGEDTELDRSVIEEISDPLIHLLRNSVDHGLEKPEERIATGKLERGTILLTARHEQGRIIITVEDDGRGIDIERVKEKAITKGLITEKEASGMTKEEAVELIFAAGLSTAKVISDVSGRGVGMDIVRNNIEHLNGSVIVETWEGRGSQFQIVLPLTLAIMPTLLVRVGNNTFAIPLVTVTETLRILRSDISTVNGRPVIQLRNHVLPVTRLADAFNLNGHYLGSNHSNSKQQEYVVVVRSGKTQLGLAVEELIGEQEVVVKSLSTVVGEVVGVSGAAILGDGQVALIVDIQGLMKLATNTMTRFDEQN